MVDFFTSTWSSIITIHWSTWVSLIIFIGFGARGFKRGIKKELIGFSFLILSLVVAWVFYETLSTYTFITWLSLSTQSNMAIAFGVIFVAMEMTKIALYKITVIASRITDPCVLNKSFLVTFLLIATAVFSYYIDVFFDFNIVQMMVTSGFFRSSLSFAIMFFAVIGLFVTLTKPFNFSIRTSRPCFLSAFIQSILNIVGSLNNKLDTTNAIDINNRISGSVVGLIKGFAFIIVMILILQSINVVSQEYFWVESKSALRIFQDVASSIKPELSKYLHFIKE